MYEQTIKRALHSPKVNIFNILNLVLMENVLAFFAFYTTVLMSKSYIKNQNIASVKTYFYKPSILLIHYSLASISAEHCRNFGMKI